MTGNINTPGIIIHIIRTGHADVVVKAMEGFTLSSNSIPEWAKVVPEEVWKNELLAGLKPNKSLKRDSR